MTRTAPIFLLLLGLALAACTEDEEVFSRKLCDPIAGEVNPALGPASGGYEVLLGGRFIASSYGILDTAVRVGGVPATAIAVDAYGCGACEACLLEADYCVDCWEVCDGLEGFEEFEAEECIEEVLIEIPPGVPGTVAITVFNGHGATQDYTFTYQGFCEDGEDNDGDGLTDGDDPGCTATGNAGESGPCENGEDDDGDGWIDLDDPGCAGESSGADEDLFHDAACNNGVDDDMDGFIDADDTDCDDGYDESEFPEE